jgi:hypothetical protein
LTSTAFGTGGSLTYSSLGTLNVSMGSGGNTFTVASTAPGTATTVNSGTGSDTVNVQATSSPLTVNTQAGTDTVNVQAIGAPASVNAGGGNDTINVSSNAPTNTGKLSGIAAVLTVNGGTGSSTANVSDTGDSTASTSTLTGTALTSTAFGTGGSLSYSSLGTLNVSMGSGGNAFTVASTAPATATTVNSGTGSDTVNVVTTSSPLTVNTQAGTDTVNVQAIGAPASINAGGGNDTINVSSNAPTNTGKLSGIAAVLTVNGGTGSSTVNVSDTGDSTASTSTLTGTALTSTAFGTGGSLSYSSLATLNVSLGSGGSTGNAFNINVPSGQNLPATTNLNGGSAGKDTLVANWVKDFNGTLNILGFATSTVTVGNNFNGSMTDKNPGYISSITIGGSLTASGVLQVVSTSDPANPTTPTGLLGDIGTMTVGGLIAGLVQVSGNLTTLNVGPANTPTTGGVNDLTGQVIVGGALTTASVSGNVSGSITETLTTNSLYIGGSLTQTGLISAVNTVNPALGNINTLTIGQDFAGTVIVSGTLGTFNLGGSFAYTAALTVGNLNSMTIQGDMAGRLTVTHTLGMLTVHGGTPGTVTAGQIGTIAVYGGYGPVVAQIKEAGIQRRIEAAVPSSPYPVPPPPPAPPPPVSPTGVTFQYFYEGLYSPTVEGLNPSTNLANPQLTTRVTNATGNKGPDQFDLSLITYNDAAKFNLARLDTPSFALTATTTKGSPTVSVAGKSGLAVGQAVSGPGIPVGTTITAISNSSNSITLSSAATATASNVALSVTVASGVRNVAVEGDLLTSVSTAAQGFFSLPNTAGGISLPADALAGVGVRDFIPNSSIQATSIQAVAFGSHAEENGQIFTGAASQDEDAQDLLVTGTALVQANDTFRAPFADLATQQVQLFVVTDPNGGHFDDDGIVLVVQSVTSPNAAGTGNIVTPSNVARGAVTALVKVVPTYDSHGKPQSSVVQSIDLRGDGGSIQTEQSFSATGSITSTGPLGDLTLQESQGLYNLTAPSVFGSININGPITGIAQTTGQRTDPITSVVTTVPADLGRLYVDASGKAPVVTSTTVTAGGLSGELVSRGDLISQVTLSGGPLSGVLAVQGNLGKVFTPTSGPATRLGGVLVNGAFSGELVTLGLVYADMRFNGGLKGGRIAAKGGIIGNLRIDGGLDAAAAVVSGGEIGDTTWGTQFTFNGSNKGILAAKGTMNFAKGSPGGNVFNNATGTNAAAIDAIFTDMGKALSFDLSGLDLGGLSLMLTDLAALYVDSNGNLAGPKN